MARVNACIFELILSSWSQCTGKAWLLEQAKEKMKQPENPPLQRAPSTGMACYI